MKTLNEDKAYSIGEIQGLKIETQGFSHSFNDLNPNCIFLAILPIYTLFYLFHLLHTDVYMAHKAILPRKKKKALERDQFLSSTLVQVCIPFLYQNPIDESTRLHHNQNYPMLAIKSKTLFHKIQTKCKTKKM